MKIGKAIKGKLKALYNFRHMYYSLVQRSLYGKYKNSVLGFLWNFLTPTITILLFYIVFSNFMGGSIDHFWAYLCVGMFPFQFMNDNLIGGASNITSNGEMVKKMYFPREILPLSQVTYTFIVFLIAYGIIAILMYASGALSFNGIWAFPIVLVTMFIFTFGTILFTSSISVYSRDFQYLITALSRILFWVTPIFYTIESVSGLLYRLLWFNPLTYYVEGFHSVMYHGTIPGNGIMLGCIVLAIASLTVGLWTFNKLKDGFAERI